MKKLIIILFALAVAAGCAEHPNTITQVSTIDALLAGDYDGSMSTDNLSSYGSFGIGTFDKLDGEMIMLDGKVYQAKSDGKIYTPENLKVPFATVSDFKQDKVMTIYAPTSMKGMEAELDNLVPDKNMFLAIKAEGKFRMVKARSVPAQEKPYKPLAEVVNGQTENEYNYIDGTVIGYRMPEYMKGLNVGGYHLHFISKDKTVGGHVLDFTMSDGAVMTDSMNKFYLILPERGLMNVDLTKDRSAEVEKVEK